MTLIVNMHNKSPQAAVKAHMLHLFYGSSSTLELLFGVFNYTTGWYEAHLDSIYGLNLIIHPVLELDPSMSL